MTSIQQQTVARVPARMPRPAPLPMVPPSRFTLPPDLAQMRPAARTQIRAEPLFPGDRALVRAVQLITTIASRPGGYVYMANWYASHNTTLPSGWTLATALQQCQAQGGTIRALFWEGSMRQLDPLIATVTAPLVGPTAGVVRTFIRKSLAARFTNITVNTATMRFINNLHDRRGPRAFAALDDSTLNFGSHHQKILVVGNSERIDAIVGGVDWNQDRITRVRGDAGSPLYDISVQLDGRAAVDIAELFERRWRADPARARIPLPTGRPPSYARPGYGATVQIAPNFGCKRPFTTIPYPIRGANSLITNALHNCRSFFYGEDQYGIGNQELEAAIKRAFANGAHYGVIVLASASAVSDIPEISYRRWRFWSRFPQWATGQLMLFDRLGDDGSPLGPHAYVHSKLFIVDDRAATISSLNMNRRSWYNDSEFAALITDAPDVIRGMRIGIWRKHLGLNSDDPVRDPVRAMTLWRSTYNAPGSSAHLKPIRFWPLPPARASAGIVSSISSATNLAVPLVGVGGWAIGRAAQPYIRRMIDQALDTAFDLIYDPDGRCPSR